MRGKEFQVQAANAACRCTPSLLSKVNKSLEWKEKVIYAICFVNINLHNEIFLVKCGQPS